MAKTSKSATAASEKLIVRGAREHNLRNIDVELPREKLVVITGLSGSGKSSLAFDTIYAEGQRRYVESLSAYARQFLGLMEKPDVDSIEGLSPAISIEQKTVSRNPRSTVGTVTEIYDYLRLLWARAGTPHCPTCGDPVIRQSATQIVDQLLALEEGNRIEVLAPLVRGRKGEFVIMFEKARKEGFVRVRVDGKTYDLTEPPQLNRYENHDISVVVDRLVVREKDRERLADSVETALRTGDGIMEVIEHVKKSDPVEHVFSEYYACDTCGTSLPELEPRQFSFNSPYGACEDCGGLGTRKEVNPNLLTADPSVSILEGVILPWGDPSGHLRRSVIPGLAEAYEFDPNTPWGQLEDDVRHAVLHGSGDMKIRFPYKSGAGEFDGHYQDKWEGVLENVERRYRETQSEVVRNQLDDYMSTLSCGTCSGTRLKASSRAVTIGGKSLGDVVEMSIGGAAAFIDGLPVQARGEKPKKSRKKNPIRPLPAEIAGPILKEVGERLRFLRDVGLEYLTLGRSAGSLSGGEAQRIRLATQIGSQLVGVLYILDEPSIGLHQRDNARLLATLQHLRDLGNTVVVVEHDEDTIRMADYIVDLGPGAGRHGGEVVASGNYEEFMESERSLTAAYLRGDREIAVPKERRPPSPERILTVRGARGNNLQKIDVGFPLGAFICVTGVSGSGKSTLVNETLYHALARLFYRSKLVSAGHDAIHGLELIDKVIDVDQSPIGRTPRSNPATYTGLFTPIRELFANLPESQMRGYGPGRFSFNVKGGRCEACSGDGLVKIEMHFLPDVYVPCDVCRGRRYNRETLDVYYKGKNIADVLDLTVEDALDFFEPVPKIKIKLQTLHDVGLGYVHLGQSATTLSGGEAQRVKLATELSKKATGQTLYILDEPTTGLHFEDVRVLLDVLHRLVDLGNTVVVIEHNLHVVKTADWVIDLGPEGGAGGGRIVVEGTPEEVAKVKESYTGQHLAPLLES
ncbi:MAG: excinuclease ABC subunit UvrA [Gemmatimonadales bacterium]|jgi:excinuclease ABC subunit A|nr:excinuclease ABC subunit UvrA [Gemmatimonadales bacterium]MBT3775813.1 excinuclease ABC subunit UvrA [Gemmatimonadales bacterium]MBT3958433.1 excinuclease ABC subunit UvrA [Gemmatimonadales bacterium]MBT4188495.1 excinuclease ABC subunit UvrA [Gemmatimonadales bacterium]MBT4437524.1 excinuclease ABC subunit UvrA [Gemmatimonadales bacterium]